MKKLLLKIFIAFPFVICILCCLSSCFAILAVNYACCVQEYSYYKDEGNFKSYTGVVDEVIEQQEYKHNPGIYLILTDLSEKFDDCQFIIQGDNCKIVIKNGFSEKVKVGDTIEFVTSRMYFGDGYEYPIVGLSVNGETLLDFDEGYENLMKWYKEKVKIF